MKEVDLFSFRKTSSSREIWKLESELLINGSPTNTYIPGTFIEAQYVYKDLYLIATSWRCSYEDSLEFLLLSRDLQIQSKRYIGQLYSSIFIEKHEPIAEDQLVFHCNKGIDILITAKSGLLFSHQPILLIKMRHSALTEYRNS